MSINISNESKSDISISNESKPVVGKWNSDATRTWGDGGTWGQPGTFLAKESKNSLTVTPESKL